MWLIVVSGDVGHRLATQVGSIAASPAGRAKRAAATTREAAVRLDHGHDLAYLADRDVRRQQHRCPRRTRCGGGAARGRSIQELAEAGQFRNKQISVTTVGCGAQEL